MLSKQELIEEVLLLPIEDRTYIIDSLIQSMNPIDSDIDRKWLEVSKKRLNELKSGEVKGVPGDEVFSKIWKRFEK
ncbi:addiction module protein [uncultured Desulfobacter sp.]|uniref:addiction module protein n=1 Tax=uncultured Desulfobacter sp. TaxID=240139 RepID=UPI0029F58773|nr:addiction module protein [uncultured Desulfobacter sp.]